MIIIKLERILNWKFEEKGFYIKEYLKNEWLFYKLWFKCYILKYWMKVCVKVNLLVNISGIFFIFY